jgi:DNA-binding transcriptional regulator YiaG
MEYKDKLKLVRKKLIMSQQDFAKALGVGYSTLNRWENGLREPNYIGQRKFKELCQKHGINFEDLFVKGEAND